MEEAKYTKEQQYLKAKKRVEDIKGFYVHFTVFALCMPVIIITNLMFVPGFYYFWFALFGWGIGIFFHWLGVFGFTSIGLGKDWEQRKIKELMNDQNFESDERR